MRAPSRARATRPARLASLLVALACALVVLLGGRRASAWVEQHVARDDVRLVIGDDGRATVEHRIVLLVSGGPLPEMVVRGVDDDAAFDAGSYVVPKKSADAGTLDGATALTAERVPPAADAPEARTDLTLRFEGAGLSRGSYLVFLRYTTDLRERGLLVDDGATGLVTWRGPSWDDGLETTKATFELRPGATAPRAAENGEDDLETFLSSLTRRSDADVLEVVRPYAARGERVTWRVRVDRRAVGLSAPAATSPATPAVSGASLPTFGDRRASFLLLGGLAAFALLAALVLAQSAEQARRARDRGLAAQPLVPLPAWLRGPLAAAAWIGGLWLHLELPSSLPGACVIAASTLLVWQRPARAPRELRGPGTWLAVSEAEVFAGAPPAERAYFDTATVAGKALLAALVLALGGCAALASRVSTYHAVLFAFDALPWLAIPLTAGARSLRPDLAVTPIAFFDRVRRRLARTAAAGVRVIPRVRLPKGSADADEVRLLFLPRHAKPGLVSLELATARQPGPGGWILLPELLLRVREGSPCHEAALALPAGRPHPGRRADERVLAFAPKLPTGQLTAELCAALLDAVSAPERTSTRDPEEVASELAEKKRQAPTRRAPVRAPQPAVASGSGTRAARSGGSGEVTTNAGTVASPDQAIRAAWSA